MLSSVHIRVCSTERLDDCGETGALINLFLFHFVTEEIRMFEDMFHNTFMYVKRQYNSECMCGYRINLGCKLLYKQNFFSFLGRKSYGFIECNLISPNLSRQFHQAV